MQEYLNTLFLAIETKVKVVLAQDKNNFLKTDEAKKFIFMFLMKKNQQLHNKKLLQGFFVVTQAADMLYATRIANRATTRKKTRNTN